MKYVLFVCNHNAGRSQMAHAFFDRLAPDDLKAESAGSYPADAVWPEVIEVMKEVGIDLSAEVPKKLDPEMQLNADWAVTMGCGDVCPYVPATVEDWDLADPKGQPLERVREIRDEIKAKVEDLLARAGEIRNDDNAHQIRLKRILPSLVEEFGNERDANYIRQCADTVLSKYADAPVRSFMIAIAQKEIRACLKEESCAVLATSSV